MRSTVIGGKGQRQYYSATRQWLIKGAAMGEGHVDVDYLIVGAGATAMAFADSLLTETDASMLIVDRRHRPGGHWNDAYPFVRLHQPAATYGVNSTPLGTGAKDEVGYNKGFYELASGQEVLAHYDQVMRQRLLPSGRVRYLPMSDVTTDGTVTSLLSGEITSVAAGRRVDATYSTMQIPSTHPPRYTVGDGVVCIPPNDLPRLAAGAEQFVVIGAGKTGLDACVWLLENRAVPERITWIVPRDPWMVNRVVIQPGDEFLERVAQSVGDQVQALAESHSIDEVFARLEAAGELMRLDPSVTPTLHHCAAISEGELEQLRRIHNIVRMGRVASLDNHQIILENGTIPAREGTVYVDCSAVGIPRRPTTEVFDGDTITLQWVRLCQPAFSAAFIAHVEATVDDDDERNRICQPIAPSDTPADWLRMMSVDLDNRYRWSKIPHLAAWLRQSRLDGFAARISALTGDQHTTLEHLNRYRTNVAAATTNIHHLLQQHDAA